MSSITPDVNIGFLTLTGSITQVALDTVKISAPPLSVSFGPRTTIPGIVSNKIDDTVSNTCTYRGIQYNLVDIQICSPIHTGYNLPGISEQPIAELVLTFYKLGTGGGTKIDAGYTACILALPIYISSISRYDTYLMQIVKPDTQKASFATLKSLFYNDPPLTKIQTSFAYKTLFQSLSSQNIYTDHQLYVVVFPNGIHTTQDIYNLLLQKIGNHLVQYGISASVLNGDTRVVNNYTNNAGTYVPSQWTDSGILPSNQFNVTTQPFTSVFEYFLSPPKLPPNAKGDPSYCVTPSQYKCMPLNSINGNSNNIDFIKGECNANTVVDDIAGMSTKLKSSVMSIPSKEYNGKDIGVIIGATVGFIVVGGILGFVLMKITEN